jgi:hypothetical protein
MSTPISESKLAVCPPAPKKKERKHIHEGPLTAASSETDSSNSTGWNIPRSHNKKMLRKLKEKTKQVINEEEDEKEDVEIEDIPSYMTYDNH